MGTPRSPHKMNMQSDPEEGLGIPGLHRVRRTILVVDVVESVRLMQAFEADIIDRWRRFVDEVQTASLPPHGGRLVKSLGDGMLIEFAGTRPAAAAAFDLHRRLHAYNAGRRPEAALQLRAGLHAAEVVLDRLDIYGPGVNIAARVAALAAPGETMATVNARDELLGGVDAELEDLGHLYVKHLDHAVHCWRLTPPRGTPAVPYVVSITPAPGVSNVVIPRLAVMPLVTHGLSGSDRFAGHLVADNLNLRLSRSHALRVISRLSAGALAGRGLTVPEVARQLGVQYVVAGSILPHGATHWRVNLELADGADGTVIWTRSDTLESAALLQADDDFSAEAARQLFNAVSSHQVQRLATHSLPSLQSYSLQLAGLELMHRAALTDFERARSVLETLVERHPRSPTPRAWLSQWWVLRTTRGLGGLPQDEAVQALGHTRSALQTDPASALALASQGFVEAHMLRDLDAAEHTLERAIACNGNEPLAWLYRSVVHGFRGQGDEAYRAAETAASLSPLDPQRHYFDALTASAAVTAGHLERGIELARRALQINRNHLPTLRALAVALAETGDLQASRAAGQRVLALQPDFTLRNYQREAPKGGETTRERFVAALARAGLPAG